MQQLASAVGGGALARGRASLGKRASPPLLLLLAILHAVLLLRLLRLLPMLLLVRMRVVRPPMLPCGQQAVVPPHACGVARSGC